MPGRMQGMAGGPDGQVGAGQVARGPVVLPTAPRCADAKRVCQGLLRGTESALAWGRVGLLCTPGLL